MVVGLIAGIIPGNVRLKACRNPFIMVVCVIVCIISGNVRLRAMRTQLSAIWTHNLAHIVSVVSNGSGYLNRHHTGKCQANGTPFLINLMFRPHALRVGSGHETNMSLGSIRWLAR